ncbi:MAG: hypothetical protein KAV87_50125 [Desulfobacteraceae bacterium]|nr:hypothetical protein [Desulfobacteraceae bacterium]
MATLGINLPNVATDFENKFSFKNMQTLMSYLSTYNMTSQAVAIDANAENIQTTGTGIAMINGQPVTIAEDAALDISACTEGTETAWAKDTSYSVGDVRKDSKDMRYLCILAHTSRDDSDSNEINNEPGSSDNWARYWEQRDHDAVNASGTVITDDYQQWFLILAKKDGTISLWEAGDQAITTTGAECKIPQFDAKTYVAIGLLHILAAIDAGTDFTVGTSELSAATCVDTFINLTGPVFPHPDNWDKN